MSWIRIPAKLSEFSYTLFIYWRINFFKKISFRKINYFLMFGSVIENKLENTF